MENHNEDFVEQSSKNKVIYAVGYSYYSDWQIYGYFNNREDADKYCVAHSNRELYVLEIPCYDLIDDDFRNISLKYKHSFVFYINDNLDIDSIRYDKYECYQDEFLHSNKFHSDNLRCWIKIEVNSLDSNEDKARKIATDLFYQYKYNALMTKDYFTDKSITDFNKILSKEEDERIELEKEKEIREKELAELKRLQEKYNVG